MNQRLLDFYRGTDTDIRGRTFQSMIEWSDNQWERAHDSIQWLFPLPDKSRHNPSAPLLDAETTSVFKTDPTIKTNIAVATARAIRFFGLPADREDPHPPLWFRARNHNHLRLTRILKFLVLMEMTGHASLILIDLLDLVERFPGNVTDETLAYWTDTMKLAVPSDRQPDK